MKVSDGKLKSIFKKYGIKFNVLDYLRIIYKSATISISSLMQSQKVDEKEAKSKKCFVTGGKKTY